MMSRVTESLFSANEYVDYRIRVQWKGPENPSRRVEPTIKSAEKSGQAVRCDDLVSSGAGGFGRVGSKD